MPALRVFPRADGMKRIRVLLAEDQNMVLGALAALLALEEDMEVVGQARNGKEALAAALEQKPDVLITDVEMPEMTGLELASEIQSRRLETRVIILTTFAPCHGLPTPGHDLWC